MRARRRNEKKNIKLARSAVIKRVARRRRRVGAAVAVGPPRVYCLPKTPERAFYFYGDENGPTAICCSRRRRQNTNVMGMHKCQCAILRIRFCDFRAENAFENIT